jgi:hypothetical protein
LGWRDSEKSFLCVLEKSRKNRVVPWIVLCVCIDRSAAAAVAPIV